jgi:hypothetical protein
MEELLQAKVDDQVSEAADSLFAANRRHGESSRFIGSLEAPSH